MPERRLENDKKLGNLSKCLQAVCFAALEAHWFLAEFDHQ